MIFSLPLITIVVDKNKVLRGPIHSYVGEEAVASGVCRVAKEDTNTNLSDLFTKVMGRFKREELIDRFMY